MIKGYWAGKEQARDGLPNSRDEKFVGTERSLNRIAQVGDFQAGGGVWTNAQSFNGTKLEISQTVSTNPWPGKRFATVDGNDQAKIVLMPKNYYGHSWHCQRQRKKGMDKWHDGVL